MRVLTNCAMYRYMYSVIPRTSTSVYKYSDILIDF